MKRFYNFGPVIVELRDFPYNKNYPFALWKADAYTTKTEAADIVIKYEPGYVEPSAECVKKDRSLYVERSTFLMPDGKILWQQSDLENRRTVLQFIVDIESDNIILTVDETQSYGMAAFESLTFIIYYLLLKKGILTFHGVIMEHENKGLIIAAPSEEGKTTHARLWRDYKGALIINSDRSPCYKRNGEWTAFGTPWCGTGGENINRSVSVKALVILKRGAQNSVRYLKGRESIIGVIPQIVYPSWNERATGIALDLLDDFLKKVPVIGLECTPSVESVEVLQDYLERLI